MTAAASPVSYPIPSARERMRTALGALSVLAKDHGRLDQVLVLLQAVNIKRLTKAVERLAASPEGVALFAEQPRIDRKHVDFEALERLPDGTLGREYVRFLADNGITPDAFEEPPPVADPRVAFAMLRMRQTHDLWHVLTGHTPDVRGELRLQAFTFAQTRSPGSALLAVFGALRYGFGWRGRFGELHEAFARGKKTAFLPLFRWEDEWATPVSELRTRLRCEPWS